MADVYVYHTGLGFIVTSLVAYLIILQLRQTLWAVSKAMYYISEKLGIENEHDLDKQYGLPRKLLTIKARSGDIQVWGKRVFDGGNIEDVRRLIKKEDWNDIEIAEWAHIHSAIRPLTVPLSYNNPQNFTDLHISQFQILIIRWKAETDKLCL